MIFCAGLVLGWIVLGRLLLPAPPGAEPSQLALGYQRIYLRLLAESFWLTQDPALIQSGLGSWDRQAVDANLAQMAAEATDDETLARLLALRSALDMPYVPLTLFGYVRSHSAIMLSSALSLAMLVAAAGVGAAPL